MLKGIRLWWAERKFKSAERKLAESTANLAIETNVKAALFLSPIDANALVEPLTAKLKDKDKNVRLGAARALGQIGSVEAVTALTEALSDNDPDVRKAVEEALTGILG